MGQGISLARVQPSYSRIQDLTVSQAGVRVRQSALIASLLYRSWVNTDIEPLPLWGCANVGRKSADDLGMAGRFGYRASQIV